MNNKFWSPLLGSLTPYVPGEQPQDKAYIKLNTNESPYPPSSKALAAMQAAIGDDLRRYPDPSHKQLKQSIANFYELDVDSVFVGNGSDEVLAHAFVAFFKNNKPVCMPDISYGFYPVYCKLFEVEAKIQPINASFQIELDAYPNENGGVLFANPNAPTGQANNLETIEKFLQKNTQSVVLIDEAYVDYGGETAVSLIDKYENLLIVQTFSKSRALAGVRIGFAMGQPHLIDALERVKNSFNPYPLSREAQAGGAASMDDVEYFRQTRDMTIATRERVSRTLREIGYDVLPSKTNFILVKHPAFDSEQTYLTLKQEGVLVRYFATPAILASYLRISIGTDDEMNVMLDILKTKVHR